MSVDAPGELCFDATWETGRCLPLLYHTLVMPTLQMSWEPVTAVHRLRVKSSRHLRKPNPSVKPAEGLCTFDKVLKTFLLPPKNTSAQLANLQKCLLYKSEYSACCNQVCNPTARANISFVTIIIIINNLFCHISGFPTSIGNNKDGVLGLD